MPATVSSKSAAHANGKPTTSAKSTASRKTRVIRRRGRGANEMDSDEEIVREAASDSDSDGLSSSSTDTDEDDEEEEENESNVPNPRVHSPSTTQSPSPTHDEVKTPAQDAASAGPFARTGTVDWSEMMAEEDEMDAKIPIIDFKELDAQTVAEPPAPRPHKKKTSASPKKKTKASPSNSTATTAPLGPPPATADNQTTPAEEVIEDQADGAEPISARETTRQPHPRHFSARQNYQERLEKDPSFVPRIGEFWGHDDRLFEPSLRPLSGYWRARGRGGFGPRGRGRGGFIRPSYEHVQNTTDVPADSEEGAGLEPPQVPAIDRQWTHDGFEEMKRREDVRRKQQERKEQQKQQQQQQQTAPLNHPPRGTARGRGGSAPGTRGRGGPARGGGPARQPAHTQTESPAPSDTPVARSAPTSIPTPSTAPRVRYAMTPERFWTKHHENYLYIEPNMKPRPGVGPGFKVRLPGGDGYVVRAPVSAGKKSSTRTTEPPSTTSLGKDGTSFTVRLPTKGAGAATAPPPAPSPPPALEAQPVPDTAIDAPTIAPEPLVQQPSGTVAAPEPAISAEATAPAPPAPHPRVFLPRQVFAPEGGLQMDLGPQAVENGASAPPPAEATSSDETTQAERPALAPIAIPTFSAPPAPAPAPPPPQPPAQASPQYGSPYGYHMQLPPGIAFNQHGMPYEMATGRPVYLPTPPPAPMYAPHPHVPHPGSMPFVPGHMHTHSSISSMSSLSGSSTPTLTGFVDPVTGRPIFTPARQSSRIEIRAPTDAADGKPAKTSNAPAQPSTLRTAVSAGDTASGQATSSTMQPSAPEWYPPYPQPYYYPPEQQYGYQPYMDMSQVQNYEMYSQPPPEHMHHHQSVYY